MSLCGPGNTIDTIYPCTHGISLRANETKNICSTSGDTGGWTVAMYQSLILMVRSVNRISLFGLFFNRVLLLYERTFCRLFNADGGKKIHCAGKEMKALNVIILEMLRNKGTYQICIKVKEKTKRRNVRVQNRNVLFVFLRDKKKISK